MNFKTIATSCASLLIPFAGAAGIWAAGVAPSDAQTLFQQTNLVSDIPGLAKLTDPQLVNAWGISFGPSTPFWISDNGTGLSTLYSVTTSNGVTKAGLVVTIPPASGTGTSAPTGQVFNPLNGLGGAPSAFKLSNGSPALFLFASEDGAITGWNPGLGTSAEVAVPTPDAVYKGLALTTDEGGRLFATNFHSGMVEMYDSSFHLVASFTDPNVPAGYAPFGDRVIGDKLYVTFALQNSEKHDDVPGLGNGFVDVVDLSTLGGNSPPVLQRLVSNGQLDSPWGLEIAPSTFGQFAGDLLVGNFGNGMINAYNKDTGAFEGTLMGPDGKPIVIDGLWGLTVGNGAGAGSLNSLYFTAGPNGESNGLFGSLTAVPETSTWVMMLAGFAGLVLVAANRKAGPRLSGI